jgi:hypothetical protein
MTLASRARLLELPQEGVLFVDMENMLNRWGRSNVAATARRNGRVILPSVSNHQRAEFIPMAEVVRIRERRGATAQEGGRDAASEMDANT